MSDIINNAREVYYKLPRDTTTGTDKIVPVRGMYVTGEYTPPEYIEPVLQLLSIKPNKATIKDYYETTVDPHSGASHHLFNIDADDTFRIDWYTTASGSSTVDATQHLFDVDADDTFRIDSYKASSYTPYSGATHHLFNVDINDTFSVVDLPVVNCGSQPEPMLRIIEINVSGVVIEDVT